MNEGKQDSCYTMNVLANKKSSSETTGCITTRGGIGVGKNIYVKNEICAEEVITRKNARIGKDLYVMGTIEAAEMFYLRNDEFVVMKHIVPDSQSGIKYNIGSNNNRWNNLYTNTITSRLATAVKMETMNIDIKNNISIGSNAQNNNSMMYIDENNIVFNGDIMMVDNNMNPVMNINQDTKNLGIFNITTKSIEYSPQVVEIKEKDNIVKIESNIILIKNHSTDPIITIQKSNKSNISQPFKVILLTNVLNTSVKIIIGDKHRYINRTGDYVEGIAYDASVHILNKI